MPTTPKLALPYPVLADTADVPRDMAALANSLDPLVASIASGTYAARPAFGKAGRIYVASDTGGVYLDTGTAWSTISVPMVNGLPTSGMAEGDEVFLTVIGGSWHCRYRSAWGDAYKWEVMGGFSLYAQADPLRSTTSQTYITVPTDGLSLVTPRPGIYDITYEADVGQATQAIASTHASYSIGGASTLTQMDTWSVQNGIAGGSSSVAKTTRHTLGGGVALSERFRMDAGAGNIQIWSRRMYMAPVRVGP